MKEKLNKEEIKYSIAEGTDVHLNRLSVEEIQEAITDGVYKALTELIRNGHINLAK